MPRTTDEPAVATPAGQLSLGGDVSYRDAVTHGPRSAFASLFNQSLFSHFNAYRQVSMKIQSRTGLLR